VKAAIRRASQRLDIPFSRVRDIWYGDARRIDAEEMDMLRQEAEKAELAQAVAAIEFLRNKVLASPSSASQQLITSLDAALLACHHRVENSPTSGIRWGQRWPPKTSWSRPKRRNAGQRRRRSSSNYCESRDLQIAGKLLRPTGLKTEAVQISMRPSSGMNEETRKAYNPISLGALDLYPNKIEGSIGMPADVLSPIWKRRSRNRKCEGREAQPMGER
jgi:hypothetical protein